MTDDYGSNILLQSLYLTQFPRCVFAFYAEIQDGRQMTIGRKFCRYRSHTVSEISVSWNFAQKFKMAAKMAGKQYLAKGGL